MDFEHGLIAAVLREGYDKFLDVNLDLKIISPSGRKVIEFITDHYNQYTKTPNILLVESATGGDFSNAIDEPVSFWVNHLRRKFTYALAESCAGEIPVLNNQDPYKAIERMRDAVADADSVFGECAKLDDAMNAERTMKYFERIWAGDNCIPTPWDSFTEKILGGWRPQDLAVIAARPGIGKSFLLLMLCQAAWRAGHRVLFVTTEMSQSSIELRNIFLAKYLPPAISYGRLKRGMISNTVAKWIATQIEREKKAGAFERYKLMGDGFDVHLESIESKIAEFKPDLVAIDGTYLLKCKAIKETDKYRRISETFDRIKSIGKRHDVAFIVTTQLNRPPKQAKNQKADIDRIAFSDNVGMVSDYVFFLSQDDDMRSARKMDIECGKLREGEDYSPVHLNWNFEKHDFSEIPKVVQQPPVQQQVPVSNLKKFGGLSGLRAPED